MSASQVNPPASELLGEAIALLGRLVSFPSVSSASNRDAIVYLAEYFGRLGATVVRLPNAAGDKENLWATFGDARENGVVLSGHIDVVPTEGQEWTRPPFALTREGDRLYGRGTTDMKGFLACVMAVAARIDVRTLERPIHVAITFDEEVGCVGARELVGYMEAAGLRPDAIVVGEPTSLAVVDRHKGSVGFTTEIFGKAAHSSGIDLGLSAIQVAADLIAQLKLLGDGQRDRPADSAFPYPYPSINVGTIQGGWVRNIVAPTCTLEWEIRPIVPAQLVAMRKDFDISVEDVIAEYQRLGTIVPEIVTRVAYDAPPLVAVPISAAVSLALKCSGRNETQAVSYGTEAGIYQEAGHAAVVCGPGDIEQAHTADEWIAVDELAKCLSFVERIVDHYTRR
jgi:acetylornithine deacetylase